MHNTRSCLQRALESALHQTLQRLECIIIDDGSDDGSQEICAGYAQRHGRRFTLISQRQAGVAAARNRGLERARGEYLAFLDSDDCLAPDFCARLLDTARTQQADIAKGTAVHVESDGTLHADPHGLNRRITGQGSRLYFFTDWWSAIYSRALIERHGLRFHEELSVCEDMVFQNEALMHCRSLAVCDEARYFWCCREDSASRGDVFTPRQSHDRLRGWKMLADSLSRHQAGSMCRA